MLSLKILSGSTSPDGDLLERRKRQLESVQWHEGRSIGSIVGELKKLDDFEHDREFVIVPPVGDPVVCTFPDSMRDEMGQYWSKTVKVSGVLTYRSDSPFPSSVEVDDGGVSVYRENRPRRSLREMRGVFSGHQKPVVEWDSLLNGR